MTIDWTKPVRFKESKVPVRVLCTDAPTSFEPKKEVLIMSAGGGVFRYHKEYPNRHETDPWHLENIPEEVTAPLFVYLLNKQYHAYRSPLTDAYLLVGKLNLTISDNRITKCEIL